MTWKARTLYVLSCLVYRCVLDGLYVNSVQPVYSYMGITVEYIGHFENIISYLVLGGMAFLISKAKNPLLPSVFIINFIYLTTYIPVSLLYAWGGMNLLPYVYLSISLTAVIALMNRSHTVPSRFNSCVPESSLMHILLCFSFVTFLILMVKYGFKMPTSLVDVYGDRADYMASLGEGRNPIAYILGWQGNVINIVLVAWGVTKRKYSAIAVGVIIQLMIFGVTGLKSLVYGLAFAIWILIALRYARIYILHYMSLSYVAALLLASMIDSLLGVYFLSATLVYRLFIIPAQLYYYYYDFISKDLFTFFSQYGIFNIFLKYPYDAPLKYTIADVYFDQPEMGANANMWAEAYASAGLIGMILIGGIFVMLLRLINRISFGKNRYLAYAALAIPVFTLTNTSLFTTFTSHGLLVALMLLYMMPKKKEQSQKYLYSS